MSMIGDVCQSSEIWNAELALPILSSYGGEGVCERDDGPTHIGQPCRGGCTIVRGEGHSESVVHGTHPKIYATHNELINPRMVETKVTMTLVSPGLFWIQVAVLSCSGTVVRIMEPAKVHAKTQMDIWTSMIAGWIQS